MDVAKEISKSFSERAVIAKVFDKTSAQVKILIHY
jgi:hypothetical protein